MSVQRAYKPRSEDDAREEIQAQRDAGKKLRQIAAGYGAPITHGDIHRILHDGIFPKGEGKRAALRLPAICPACTQRLPRLRPPLPAWVREAAQYLAELERQAGQVRVERVYARGGKRVEIPIRETLSARECCANCATTIPPPAG